MAFNASQFRASFEGANPAPSNTYEAFFNGIPIVMQGKPEAAGFRDVIFRTEALDLPARQVETQERRYSGPQRLVPYGLLYATQQVQFLEDSKYSIRTMIDEWQDSIFNGREYSVRYYDEIICPEFVVRMYDKLGQVVRTYRFKEVYPISVNPSQMAWSDRNSYVRVPVELAYHEFTVENP